MNILIFLFLLYSCSDIDVTGMAAYDPEPPPTPIKTTIVPIANKSLIELTFSSCHFNTAQQRTNQIVRILS